MQQISKKFQANQKARHICNTFAHNALSLIDLQARSQSRGLCANHTILTYPVVSATILFDSCATDRIAQDKTILDWFLWDTCALQATEERHAYGGVDRRGGAHCGKIAVGTPGLARLAAPTNLQGVAHRDVLGCRGWTFGAPRLAASLLLQPPLRGRARTRPRGVLHPNGHAPRGKRSRGLCGEKGRQLLPALTWRRPS